MDLRIDMDGLSELCFAYLVLNEVVRSLLLKKTEVMKAVAV